MTPHGMAPHSHPPPPLAGWAEPLACPHCRARATLRVGPQACERCQRRFTLTAGPALDPGIVPPPPHPQTPKIWSRWSAVVTYQFATLDPIGVTSGTLDPVVAMAPIDQVGIAFRDVASIAIWRTIGWTQAIVGVLVPLPIALFSLYGALLSLNAPKAAAFFAGVALVFGAIAFILVRRGVVVGIRHARVVGAGRALTLRFEKSPAFHAELFRRCGLAPPQLP